MDKKRPVGVTILSLSFVIFNTIGLIIGFKYIFSPQINISFPHRAILYGTTLYLVLFNIIGIFVSVNLLKLKEWARKLTIGLAVLSVLTIALSVFLPNSNIDRYNKKKIKQMEEQYNNMTEDTRLRLNIKSKDEYINGAIEGGDFVYKTIFVIYGLMVLFFFTRPKVKGQFK